MPIHFLPQASDEMNAAAQFYEEKSSNLGKQFLTEIKHLTSNIEKIPTLGKKIRPEIHRRFVKGFPYALLYGIEQQHIVIIAVMHLRRNPDYWSSRIK